MQRDQQGSMHYTVVADTAGRVHVADAILGKIVSTHVGVGATEVEEYFDGHFVLSVSLRASKVLPLTWPSTRMARPSRKAEGTAQW